VEIVAAQPAPRRDGRYTHGKNPRKFNFEAIENNERHAFEIDIHSKFRSARQILERGSPDTSVRLEASTIREMASWVAKRYSRPAFPTAFNERITPRIKQRLEGLLELNGIDVKHIFIALNTFEELASEQAYEAQLRLVLFSDVRGNEASETRATLLVAKLQEILNQCSGITVYDAIWETEAEFTLEDLNHTTPWDFEYLSGDLE
jgi:hypothetical protein